MTQTHSSSLGIGARQIWPAIITGHVVVTEVDQQDPIWGGGNPNDPSRGVVYEWESSDGVMQMPTGALEGDAIPDPLNPFISDCQVLFRPVHRYARNLARGDPNLCYPRIPIGTPTLMWVARPPRLVDPTQNCTGIIIPNITRVPPPWICFMEYIEPLSTYCDCDAIGDRPWLPTCPEGI